MEGLPGLEQSRKDHSDLREDLVTEIHWDDYQTTSFEKSSNHGKSRSRSILLQDYADLAFEDFTLPILGAQFDAEYSSGNLPTFEHIETEDEDWSVPSEHDDHKTVHQPTSLLKPIYSMFNLNDELIYKHIVLVITSPSTYADTQSFWSKPVIEHSQVDPDIPQPRQNIAATRFGSGRGTQTDNLHTNKATTIMVPWREPNYVVPTYQELIKASDHTSVITDDTYYTASSQLGILSKKRRSGIQLGSISATHTDNVHTNNATTMMVPWREPDYTVPTYHELIKASDHKSVVTENTYYTALSRLGMQIEKHVPGQLCEEDEYAQLLQSRKLWPVDPMSEQNWSGRGQHAKFQTDEQDLINNILKVKGNLGSTRTAIVQSVKCGRILLARKTIPCGRQTMTREEAIAEVSHLTRLNHSHIVRVIGTYVKGRELSILLYPVADYNLETFLDEYRATPEKSDLWISMRYSRDRLYCCLSSAVQFIHRNLTKHMDIKPQNILIQQMYDRHYHVYVADFGIARSYETPEEIETDGRTSFTKRYAAPEVVNKGPRGLPADIFSLGCVFLEITSICFVENSRVAWEAGLQSVFDSNVLGDTSYQANATRLQLYLLAFLDGWTDFEDFTGDLIMLIKMLYVDPRVRPRARDLVAHFGELPCCVDGSVQLQEMAKDVSERNG